MAELSEIVQFLDTELKTEDIADYSGAQNGLQLENNGKITKVATAVDASLATIREAVQADADLLIVHHGLFWQSKRKITGSTFKKLKMAISGNLAIYSSHLPLDVHSEWGNNVLLAQKLGLNVEGDFLPWNGQPLGLFGEWQGSWQDLEDKVTSEVGVILASTKSRQEVGRLGLITGGAGSEVEKARAAGIDTLLTGEGPHWSFPLAEEIGLSVILAGHYATETQGVERIGQILKNKFNLSHRFIHLPTGL